MSHEGHALFRPSQLQLRGHYTATATADWLTAPDWSRSETAAGSPTASLSQRSRWLSAVRLTGRARSSSAELKTRRNLLGRRPVKPMTVLGEFETCRAAD